jgi:NSS family neurotransmitter:Na+ symporter
MSAAKAVKATRDHWSSPALFVLASIGFVVGLKNVWQFPHHLALYGGSAFLAVYLAFLFLLGLPLFLTEVMLGRLTRGAGPVPGIAALARRAHAPRPWQWLGTLGVLAGFLVWSYFNVVAGWLLAYTARAVNGTLAGITLDGAANVFTALIRDPEKQLFWHALFVMATLLALVPGLRPGLERVVRYGVPLVFLLLLVLVGYAAGSGSFRPALEYFLRMDFSQLGADGVLVAIGDVFFSLGLGVGTLVMYGAYLPASAPLIRTALYVVVMDLAAGLLAGVAVFPVLFAGGGLSVAGPELVFQSLAVAFSTLMLGDVMRVILFVLLALIAWLSTIGLAEPVVAWLVKRRGWSRARSALWIGAANWLLGVVAILSLHPWAFSFSLFGISRSLGFFDLLVVVTSAVLLPLVGIGCALFAGWWLRPETTREALAITSPCIHDVWLWLNRLVIPALLVLLVFGIHLFL